MCLTEPQAGSSLSDVKTTAVKAKDGDYYLLSGTKCFISSGDHNITENIVHPVLARIPGSPPGVKGISLFIVPKYRINEDGSRGAFNDVVTAGIEHKLGLRGNATATLSFGESGVPKRSALIAFRYIALAFLPPLACALTLKLAKSETFSPYSCI